MAQPLSVFKGKQGLKNNWLRVIPRTKYGAFARGAKVVLYTKKSGAHLRIIDGGSGYLCEMEPVAHFGLGKDEASSLEVTWPDGRIFTRGIAEGEMNSVLEIVYPLDEDSVTKPTAIECGQGFSMNENGHCGDTDECIQFPFVCPREKPICINTYGGYKCRPNRRCNRGFEPNEDGTACVDINECDLGSHECQQLCVNLEGSHSCRCHPGFRLISGSESECIDINECEETNSVCDHICHNDVGSYHCHCYSGFYLARNGRCLKQT